MLKLILKPIKWLLSIILFFVVLIGLPLALMYKSVKVPETSNQAINIEELVEEELEKLITGTNIISLGLGEDALNNEIIKALTGMSNTSDPNYVYVDENIMFQGVWLELNEKTLNVIVGVHLNARIMTYKTRALISFEVIDSTDGVMVFKLKKVNMGNIPFKWALNLASKVVDFDKIINDALNNLGTFDKSKLELTIDLTTILETENNELIKALLNIAKENSLVSLGIVEEGEDYILGGEIDFTKLRTSKLEKTLLESDKIKSESEFETFLKDKALSSIIINGNHMNFNDFELYQVINYLITKGQNAANSYISKETVYKDFELIVGLPYFDITENLVLNVPVKLGKNGNYFKTNVEFNLNPLKENNDLVLELAKVKIGDLEIETDLITTIIGQISNEGLNFENNKFRVTGFFANFNESGIKVTNVKVASNNLVFEFEGINVSDMLNEILSNSITPEIDLIVSDIITGITNGDDISQGVSDLITEYESLDPIKQQELLDIINSYANLNP